jgi:hypothetical protein
MNDPSERSSDFVHDLGDAIHKNPLSAALIGMGALWLFTSRGSRAVNAARDTWQGAASGWRSGGRALREGAQTTADAIRGHGSQAVDRLSDAGNSLADSARDYARSAPDLAGDLLGDARANLSELFRTQPLALGAVGLAIGAAVAASLPISELEGTSFGESSDFVKQKVSEIAGEQTQRAVEIGKKVVDAVADEARQQGLTVEALTATAKDLSGKVARVASAAVPTGDDGPRALPK